MNIRISLLWRTVILLTIFVFVSQIVVYFWIQRSVNSHFEVMDAEILTYSAFNLRHTLDSNSLNDNNPVANPQNVISHLHSGGLDYDIEVFKFDAGGNLLLNQTASAEQLSVSQLNIRELVKKYGNQQFELTLNNRPYRSIIIENKDAIYLLALPIDVHHVYLHQFKWQLKLILIAITLVLISIATLSVYWGFFPLTTFIQKMKSISFEQLGERITVSDMPSELRPLAESYNIMMSKMEESFDSLSRYSDNIAHELRTPIAILSTQTQVMLSQPRGSAEYVEQLHQQHETLEQLSEMINHMLLLAKTQKGLSYEQIKDVDVDSMLNNLIEYYQLLADDRNITLLKVGEFSTVKGDKGLLQRVFANLISNAIYYSKSNSTIAINANSYNDVYETVPAKQHAPYQLEPLTPPTINIMVQNELVEPMTQNDANRLFERFYRHPTSTTSDDTLTPHSGTGLGLSIVQSIVRAHGGEVTIKVQQERLFIVAIKLLV